MGKSNVDDEIINVYSEYIGTNQGAAFSDLSQY